MHQHPMSSQPATVAVLTQMELTSGMPSPAAGHVRAAATARSPLTNGPPPDEPPACRVRLKVAKACPHRQVLASLLWTVAPGLSNSTCEIFSALASRVQLMRGGSRVSLLMIRVPVFMAELLVLRYGREARDLPS
jgi:hypothetical protein